MEKRVVGSIKHILLAVDGSDFALHAAASAGLFAREMGADISVITVHNNEVFLVGDAGTGFWPGVAGGSVAAEQQIRDSYEAHASDVMLPAAIKACGDGVTIRERVQRWGHAAEEICKYADDNDIDLIVLGTRGRSNFTRLLLGSVSSQVASHATCPVTLVR